MITTLWCQLEDMFQLIVTPQGIEKVMIQLKDTPTKVYAIGAELFLMTDSANHLDLRVVTWISRGFNELYILWGK